MSGDITPEIAERVKAEVLTMQTLDDLWVLATDYAELLDRAEKAEAERDAAFAAGWKAAIEEAQSILRESWDDLSGHAAAGLIDALPIKPRP